MPISGDVIAWSTSDEAVATVDALGVVTGVSIGNAVITATALDGSGLVFDWPIEVIRATVIIETNSNREFSVAVAENNVESSEDNAKRGSSRPPWTGMTRSG